MKKTLLIFLLVLMTMTSVFASNNIQIGPVVQFGKPVGDLKGDGFNGEDFLEIGNYQFGVDTRLNFLMLAVDAMALYGRDTELDSHVIDTSLTAGFRFSLGPIELGAGVGPSLSFKSPDFKSFTVNGYSVDNFKDVFMSSPLVYRANATVSLNKVALGLVYTVGTDLSINNFSMGALMPDFNKGRLSLSMLVNII